MTEQSSDEQKKLEAHQREFSERFAAWWNLGIQKAKQSQTQPEPSETGKREAA